MRTLVIITLLWMSSIGKNAYALDNEFSFGMAAPNPAGFSFKYWTSDIKALQFFASWSTSADKYTFQGDYLTHDFTAIPMDVSSAPFYYGVGFRIKAVKGAPTRTSIRIPLGVSYLMDTAPIDIFAELGPRLDVSPSTKFKLQIMFGIRYRIMP